MIDSFLQRPNYGELARAAHSTCASVTTIFLLTRIWARKTQYKGLWWDDYLLVAAWLGLIIGNGAAASAPGYGFNIVTGTSHGWRLIFVSLTFFYLAGGFAKTAFAVTLLRLSAGKTKVLLSVVIGVTWLFAVAMSIVTWVRICDTKAEEVGLDGKCVPVGTLIWVHIGSSIFAVFTDVVLAYLPWKIISKVYIPGKEKWGVGMSMSLVGLAAIICIARLAISGYSAEYKTMEEKVDWSYGAIVIWILLQAEVAIYIVAQAIPLLRVLALGEGSKASRRAQSFSRVASVREVGKGKSPATGLESVAEVAIELLQLPSGKIVAADSEDGKAFKASQGGRNSVELVQLPGGKIVAANSEDAKAFEAAAAAVPEPQEGGGPDINDEVHRMWADMGLSRRAWSKTPSPPPEGLHQQYMSETSNTSPPA